jgi:FkbM family methyltransferase
MQLFRKIYYLLKEILNTLTRGNKILYSHKIGSFYIKANINDEDIYIPIRSLKILKRLNNFSSNKEDIVFSWLDNLQGCRTFYDIGSANGIEGFYVNSKHGSNIVFFESFIPSLEDLIKGIFLINENKKLKNKFEVIASACGSESKFEKIYSHSPPKSGYTFNTHETDYRDLHLWKNNPVQTSNFVFSTTIDDIQNQVNINQPTHIKIDVDGYELKVLQGAKETLKKGIVQEWMIEVHKKNEKELYEIMLQHGYQEQKRFMHYPEDKNSCWDCLFVKS